ncbi:MAG TPA: hypothetical protein VNU26_06415 [Mycobacteriales bacterium]|nr:hypothetical protein [Mycobacteriales bacterium]
MTTSSTERRRPGALAVAGIAVATVVLTYLVFVSGLLFTRHEGAAVWAALVVVGVSVALRKSAPRAVVTTVLIAGLLAALAAGVLFELMTLPEDF